MERAAALMREHGHRFIVMTGPRGRPRGTLSIEEAEGQRGRVADHYRGVVATVGVGDELRTAVSLMFAHDLSWLPCVDADGVYRGHVTQRGITHLLGETYRRRPGAADAGGVAGAGVPPPEAPVGAAPARANGRGD